MIFVNAKPVQDFEHVIANMKKGEVKPTTYIMHRISFDQVKEEFDGWLNSANL